MESGNGAIIFIQADNGDLPCKEEDEEELLAYRRQFEIDQYYHDIAKFTFETNFLDLEVDEVRVWREFNRGVQLNKEQEQVMSNLKIRLQHVIAPYAERGAFVRLSTRSPKDAVDKNPNTIIPIIRQQLSTLTTLRNTEILSPNDTMVALRRAFFQAMCVRSADEALDLLSYSSRAVSDIKRALDFLHKSTWNLKIIVRKFVDIPIQFEMRGFVHNNSLNALSQYYVDCFFEDLKSRKEEIQEKVLRFFEEVKFHVKLESYIVDFVMVDDSIMIVELNPFSRSTGPCLFDWEKDKKVIEEGPFEFRILEEPNEKHATALLMPWKHLVEQAKEQPKPQLLKQDAKQEEQSNSCVVS